MTITTGGDIGAGPSVSDSDVHDERLGVEGGNLSVLVASVVTIVLFD